MKKLILPLFFLSLLGLSSCGRDNGQPVQYLIFGQYGDCPAGCIEYYKYNEGDNTLYKSTSDPMPGNTPVSALVDFAEYTGPVPEALYELIENIPSAIYDEDTVIGQPDAFDAGGFYIEIKQDAAPQYWRIDRSLDNMPEELHNFMTRVSGLLENVE